MDVFLEVLDIDGEMANEGLEEECEVSEEIVANDDLFFLLEDLDDFCEFALDSSGLLIGVLGSLVVEPFCVEVG